MAKSYLKANLTAQYEELKEAAANEDAYYIASRLDRPEVVEVADSDKHLIEALNKSIEEVAHMKQIAELDEFLKSFCAKNKFPKLLQEPHAKIEGKYVYRVCEPQGGFKMLCRYDIKNKKIEALIKVPFLSEVAQVAGRIFLCGSKPFEDAKGANDK
eukprot:TRINITY_DN2609_c0_g2_i14.p2 TRINITY_DN2609_c0_g2~~TRINITY_DN2609_c0_g2_i14.p2  ORF type:complete len:157 (-),score=34.65 TRINITY_DN2609_c0_g2_i14:613-1083(-)